MIAKANQFQQNQKKRIVESIIFKIAITAHSMIKIKHKRNISFRIGFIIEWEVVIFIMVLLLFDNVNIKYKLVRLLITHIGKIRPHKFRIYLRRTFVNLCYQKMQMSLMYRN